MQNQGVHLLSIFVAPQSLINLAPPISNKIEILAYKHATSPWFGEGRRGASLGLWWSLKGNLATPSSLAYLSWIKQPKISVFGLFPALFFHISEESGRLDPITRGRKPGKTFFLTIRVRSQIRCYLEESISSNTY